MFGKLKFKLLLEKLDNRLSETIVDGPVYPTHQIDDEEVEKPFSSLD